MSSSFFKSLNESKSTMIIVVCLVVVAMWWLVIFTSHHPNPELAHRVHSMSIMRQIGIGIRTYVADYGNYPSTHIAVIDEYFGDDEYLLDNPRDGLSGYHFQPPEVPLDEIEYPTKLAVLFEVRDDGAVAYDSGVIGYADGHVEYIQAGE